MKPFDYQRPSSFQEACRLLVQAGGDKVALAGGTDLLIRIKQRDLTPRGVVSLRDLPELSAIDHDSEKGLVIGSMTRLIDIEMSPAITTHYPALAKAVATIGSVQVRNRGTIGGNICNAAPSADSVPVLIAYGAAAVVGNGEEEWTVPMEKLITGPGETSLKAGELIKAIVIPAPQSHTFAEYYKACRSSLDIAQVGLALLVVFEADSLVCRDIKVVLGAVGPTPIRAEVLEGLVRGRRIDDQLIRDVHTEACTDACPITDVRSTEGYRNRLVEVYAKRGLEAAKAWKESGGAP